MIALGAALAPLCDDFTTTKGVNCVKDKGSEPKDGSQEDGTNFTLGLYCAFCSIALFCFLQGRG